jgi:glutamate carboxypeptidase
MTLRLARAAVGVALLSATATGATVAQTVSPIEQEIAAHVENCVAEAEALLERVVNLNSGTMNHAGVRATGAIFQDAFEALGFTTRWIEMPDSVGRAGHLFAERIGTRGRRLLLIGHLDTVFEPGDPFQQFTREGSTATGPGVVDMKGGIVAMVHALEALNAAGALDGTTIRIALIGDEEFAGLPLGLSRGNLVAAAQESDVALGFEGGEAGRAVVARRGSSAWTLEVSGQQGHSSLIFGERFGSGAIFEAARILHRFHDEVRGPEYLTFNPGIILGGTEVDYNATDNRGASFGKTNVIARHVVVDGGLRFISEEQKEAAREQMRDIVADHLPGTSAEVFFKDKYPAMPPTEENQALLALLDQVSRDLGQGPVEAFDPAERGAADISFVASYVDGLDGLGPFGSGAHTPGEQLDLVSLPAVTKRAALMIYRLTRE